MEDRPISIQPADRLSLVQEYYFSRKLKEVARLNAEGRDIISLAIGSPDMPPSEKTITTLCEVGRGERGGVELRECVRFDEGTRTWHLVHEPSFVRRSIREGRLDEEEVRGWMPS